jgi:plasmid stability protein
MVAITVRNVPTEVRDELAARAARSGHSLQEYLANELAELARRPRAAEVLAGARARAEAAGRTLQLTDILAARDHDRR